MSVNDREVAAMRERLRLRQEERRALADIDALARIVSASRRPETIGVIVPIEEARDFSEFQKARNSRGNWAETAAMAISVLGILVVSVLNAEEISKQVEADISGIVVPLNGSGKVRTDKVLVLREVPLEECGLLGKILEKKRRAE